MIKKETGWLNRYIYKKKKKKKEQLKGKYSHPHILGRY